MRFIMNVLAGLASLYMLLIFIRVLLSWFSSIHYGKIAEILVRITDPYLNWWARIPGLGTGVLDLSPIAALTVLALVQNIFATIARYGRITLGIILFIAVSAVWSALSFIMVFCFVILVLRFIAYMSNRDMYSPVWRIIDSFAQPILYRINRIIFGKRLVNYLTGIITAMAVLLVFWAGGRIGVGILARLLLRLPL